GADRTRPEDANGEARPGSFAGRREREPELLAKQAARREQADAGGGQVAGEQVQPPPVLGVGLDGLHEIDALGLAALALGGRGPVAADHLADGVGNPLLLTLLLA